MAAAERTAKEMRLEKANSVCALGLLIVSACSAGEAGWNGTIADSAGVTITTNTDQGVWTESERWTVEEELRIGSLGGDPNYQFGQIGSIGVASDGRIFVIDAQAQQVKAFSVDGQFERSMGAPGAGPGELGPGAMFVLVTPGDTLLVPDLANRRVNRYAPDGSSQGSFPLELEKGIPMQWRNASSGVVAEQVRPLALPDMPASDSMDAVLLLGSDGTVLDTLLKFPSGGTLNLGGQSPEITLFSAEPIWTVSPERTIAYGVNDDYRIEVFSAGGSLERVIIMPFERTSVADRDKEAVMGSLEQMWMQAGVPPQALPQLRSMVQFGEFFPAFAQIQVGPHGSLWVQHYQPVSELSDEELENYNLIEESGAPDWDVFNAAGQFLGRVTMPERFAPRIFVGDRVYGVLRDEMDVQFVLRLRVVGA
jgi:hypothetical protein